MSSQNSGLAPAKAGFNLWNELFGNLRLVYQLMRDPRVNNVIKIAIPAVVALFILSPIDLIPVVGEIDDLVIILLAIRLFISLAPPAVVAEYRSGTNAPAAQANPPVQGGQTVEASYRVVS